MTTALHRIARPLAPEELDDYLHAGWYRVGAALMASRFYVHDGELLSTIWTRAPLQGWELRKGQRKRHARLQRRFDIRVCPFVYTTEHEALYARYLTVAPGQRSESLLDLLGGIEGMQLFDTRVVEYRDSGRLIGFSLFDVGATTLQSLTGAYDPAYHRFGLGAHSLVAEALFGLENDLEWHYSGYVVPGAGLMDYKWQLSVDMEFLHPQQDEWRHRRELPLMELPDQRVKRKLHRLAMDLSALGIPVGWRLNELFGAPHLHESLAQCLDEPLVLVLPPIEGRQYLVTYNDHAGDYRLMLALPVMVQRSAPGETEASFSDRTWLVEKTTTAAEAADVLAWVRQLFPAGARFTLRPS